MIPFRDQVASLPDQLDWTPEVSGKTLSSTGRLFIAGLGGSAMAGEFLCHGPAADRETVVVRASDLPPWVSPEDAVLGLSYSGNTFETLKALEAGRALGLTAGVVASGGAVFEAAERWGLPRARLPRGLAPRCALGYLLRAASGVLGMDGPWDKLGEHLREVSIRWGGAKGSRAEEIASAVNGRLPVIVGAGALGSVVARRWAADLAENAKIPALAWDVPEACHNAIMALARERSHAIPLRILLLGRPRVESTVGAWDALTAVLREEGWDVMPVREDHPDPWVEAVGLAYAGAWSSLAVAAASGIPPESLSLMDAWKERLAEGAGKDRSAS